uniref:PH domain-containing protein n=1 Tax=Globisporangium ultimum (strain ATCC 200006 / CBS 805.95 / DAOM BR144) TaxID=431595 RepID=K3X625_GLOUD
MSGGGNVEGYLVKVDGDEGEIVYCILDEGILQYYSRMGGTLLGAVPLTGCKVEVFLLPDEHARVFNRFRIDTQVKASRKRSLGPPTAANIIASRQQRTQSSITFAGATRELTDRWAISVLNWNRYSWEDPQTLCSSKDEYATLKDILRQSGMKCKTETVVPLGP